MYWRRRVLVLGVIIVIIGLAVNAFRGDGAPQPDAAATDVVVLGGASAAPDATLEPVPTDTPIETAAPEPTVDEQGNLLCSADDLKVSVAVDRKTTTVGVGVHVTMAVKNTSDRECTRDVGSGANEIVISSGGDTVWSSDHCNPSDAADAVKLPAGATWSVKVVWNGKVTGAGCTIKGAAQPGSYSVKARNGKLTSSRAKFTIG